MNIEPSKMSRVSRGGSKSHGTRRNNTNNKSSTKKASQVEDEMDDCCLICASPIEYLALMPCSHSFCHKCAFRHRALYEKKSCLVCRTECERFIITEQLEKNYGDISAADIESFDKSYDIDFTSSYACKDTLGLLENKCNICKEVFSSFKKLSEHVKEDHHKFFCLICHNHRKAFISELTLYNHKGLQKHQQEGDELGFKGHPECKYCRGKRFYSEDELSIHIRDHHERCHICDKDHPKTADYYRNYDNLFKHFQKSHYVCNVASCLEKKFVVFREELDLTAHMLKEHGGLASGSKVVIGATGGQFLSQLSTFNLAEPSSSSNQTNNGSNGRNRSPDYSNEVDTYELKARRLEERAKHYLSYNNADLKKFNRINGNFRSKNISAKDLLKQYRELFKDRTTEDISLLIYELGELFPQKAPEKTQLALIYDEINASEDTSSQDRFPALSSSSSLVNINSWGTSNKTVKNNNELFPALVKPKKNPNPILQVNANSNGKSIYSKAYSKPEPKSKPKINTGISTRPVTLSYLNNSASTSSSSSSTSSSTSTSVSAQSNTKKAPQLTDSKFPALEKKKKIQIPLVNPVQTSSTWGPNEKKPEKSDSDPFGFGVPVTIKKSKRRN